MFGTVAHCVRHAIIGVGLSAVSFATAHADELSESIAFDIPAQSLEGALFQLSKQSSLQIVYAGSLPKRTVAPISGRMPIQEALDLLLHDTEFGYKLIGKRTVGVIANGATQPIGYTESNDARAQYIKVAQSDISSVPSQSASGVVSEGVELEQVVVSAEKIKRSWQDTATSVVVFDSEALENRAGLDSLQDVLARIPNVTSSGSGNLLPAVRGVDGTGPANGRDAFFGGTRGRFAYQVDGRALSYTESVFGSTAMWDVQQVEMLRGPQSSLQGRNSVGGLVAVKTKDPSYDWQSGLRLEGGSYAAREMAAYLSGPLVDDQVAFRISLDRKTWNSWIPTVTVDPSYADNPVDPVQPYNPYFDPPLILAGNSNDWIRNPGSSESTVARAKLLIEPRDMEGFSALLTLTQSKYEGEQGEWVFTDQDFARFGASPQKFKSSNGYVQAYPVASVFAPKATSGILALTWERDDTLTYESTISYADVQTKRITPEGYGNITIDASELMVEPRVRLRAFDGKLSTIAGLYYYNNEQHEVIDSAGGGAFEDETDTLAAFAESTYSFNSHLDLTFGARFEREKRDRVGGPFDTNFHAVYEEFMPKAVLSWHVTPAWTAGLSINRGYNGGGTSFTFAEPFVNYSYDPEYVTNYELFTRSRLWGNRLELTANIFRTNYQDFQLPYDLNPSPEYSIVIVNADKVETSGVELGGRALVANGLEVSLEAGFLDTKVKKYSGGQEFAAGYVLPKSEFEGHELPRAPGFTAQLGISYKKPQGWYAVGDVRYSGSYYSSILDRADERVDAFWSANAQVGYTFKHMRVYASVTNIFDKLDPLFIERGDYYFNDDGSLGLKNVPAYLLQQPRTFAFGIQIDL